VKVTPKGRKVFVVLYRLAGAGSRLRKYTIGPHGRITLAMARAHAQKIFAARLDGRDPAAEKREVRRRAVVDRVDDLIEAYIQARVSQLRSAKPVTACLRREVVSRWGTKSVHEIKRRDVVDLVTEIAQRSTGAARKTLKFLKTFFRWCVGQAVVEFSPAEGVCAPGQELSRDRVLSDFELGRVILAARKIGPPFGAIIELLALTGQRREEVAQMAPHKIEQATRTWCIPGRRTKNGKAHIVHLAEPAWRIVQAGSQHHYVFLTIGKKRFQDFSKSKRKLDRLSGVSGWRLHDLRRTVVSGMARLGTPPHVADKVLNHQSGTISGVAAVYQRHEFLDERKRALEHWASHVSAITRAAVRDKLETSSRWARAPAVSF
jgi:integrase